jgi:HEPN domain-containing protein
MAAERQLSFHTCRSKLAEVLEKVLKAELLRLGWILEKTHDLDRLLDELVARQSDLVSLVEPLCDVLAEVYFTDRYPGFDLDDPDWPALNVQVQQTTHLLERIREKVTSTN